MSVISLPDDVAKTQEVPAVPGWRLLSFETLPSTADLLREKAEAGEPDRLAIRAGQQVAGRGQLGRPWHSPIGNLYQSHLIRPGEPMRYLQEWALLAAVAVATVLEPYLPDPARLKLKWPNDVLIDGAKLVGILTEAAATPEGDIDWIGFGIGINLAVAPDLPDRATTSILRESGRAPMPAEVSPRLLAAIDHWRARRQSEGFDAVRHAWLQRGPEMGALLTLRQPGGLVQGRFAGLAADGRLLLETGEGQKAFITGEVAA